jgi:glutamate carboxypeptidase
MITEIGKRSAAIRQYIKSNHGQMLDDLRAVVEINSPSEYADGNNAVGNYLIHIMEDLDIQVSKVNGADFGQHICCESVKKEKPCILFCGHMDTVFPLGTEWPFRIEENRVFGPGVIDMKGGLISLIYAIKALHFTGDMPAGYKILFNSDEEQGSLHSRRLIPDLVKGVDFSFIMEPAEPDGSIIVKRKGIGKFEISVTGRAAHAGKSPETGNNAILEIAHQIINAEKLARKKVGTTMNTGVVCGGQSPFIVADAATALIESRVWTLDEQKRVEEGLKFLPSKNYVDGTKINVSGGFHRPPLIELPGTKTLVHAVKSAARDLGIPVQFRGSGAASDGNNITSFGIPTIDGMGPVGGREHSHDEYLELHSFYERTELLACSILHLSNLFNR